MSYRYKGFEYEIEMSPLQPPLGTHRVAAKVVDLVRRDAQGNVQRLPSPVGEVWGATADEARKKADDAIRRWIDEQP